MRTVFAAFVAASALFTVPAAGAKDFEPGDLRVCNGTRCVPVVNREALSQVGAFYYSGPCPRRIRGATLGAPYYELRFRNGYVTGIVATRQLDRFLSYGVIDQRFGRNHWYAVPRKVSAALRRLTVGLRPLRLTRAALARSRGLRRDDCL